MRDKNKGFTLIELIVVIAIIIILAALSVPRVTKYIDESRDAKRAADFDAVNLAAVASLTDLKIGNVEGASYLFYNKTDIDNSDFIYPGGLSSDFISLAYENKVSTAIYENINSLLPSDFYAVGEYTYTDTKRNEKYQALLNQNGLRRVNSGGFYGSTRYEWGMLEEIDYTEWYYTSSIEDVLTNNFLDSSNASPKIVYDDKDYNSWEILFFYKESYDLSTLVANKAYAKTDPLIVVLNDGYMSINGTQPQKIINVVVTEKMD
ncbi:MAG: prepilin-type N-terminal cleavage/methylation domain-containing protein [Lachnospirales bacterium]